MTKEYHESKTVWTSAGLLITSIVTLALHYTGSAPVSAEALGAAMTGAVSGLVFLVLRLVTRDPVGKQNEGNNTAANVSILLLVLALAGCTTIRADKSVDLRVKTGPPCVISIDVDGERAVDITGPKACGVTDER